MNRVAVVLTPTKPLMPHRQYTLLIDRVLPGLRGAERDRMQTLTWNTGGGARDIKGSEGPRGDRDRQDAAEVPGEAGGGRGLLPEGERRADRYLKLSTTLAEEAPAYFVVSLKRSRGATNEQDTRWRSNGGEASVGHDPCHGSFTFEDGRAYKLTIETFDSAGNKAAEVVRSKAQAPRPGLQWTRAATG